MSQEKKKTIAYRIVLALFFALLLFLSVYKLTAKYVDPWDEARHGVNAYEMLNGGSMVQNTYMRAADYYNLKPPLSMWCIMIGLKLFQDPVLGLRLYSVICYLLLAVITALFLRSFGRRAALFGVAALAINMTPFLAHMVRAGDADSLYVLLFSVAMMSMMKLRSNPELLYVCGLMFSLAFLTKSFHALLIAAIGGIFLIFSGQLLKFHWRQWVGFILLIVCPVLIWALLRYRIDGTAFFVQMWKTDVAGRTNGQLQNNPSPFGYYFSYYFGAMSKKVQVYVWALLLVIAAVLLRFAKRFGIGKNREGAEKELFTAQEKDILLGFFLWIALPFLAFSAVSNKLLWYQYPSVTALMIAAALAADRLWERFFAGAENTTPRKLAKVCFAGALLFIFLWYYLGTFRVVDAQSYNEFQVLVRSVAGDEKAVKIMEQMKESSDLVVVPERYTEKGCHAYVDYSGATEDWSQQDVFVAEAFGDYQCVNGGIFGLLLSSYHEGKKGVVFVERQTFEKEKPLYEDNPLLGATEGFLAFEVEY